jgi:hypothetical protein
VHWNTLLECALQVTGSALSVMVLTLALPRYAGGGKLPPSPVAVLATGEGSGMGAVVYFRN